ncbi:MAG: hypothetical protein ACQEVA_19100 [Myxococcota bacterium]
MAPNSSLQKTTEREPTEVAYRGCLFVTGIGSFVAFSVFLALTIWQIIAQGATGLLIASAVLFGLFALGGIGLFGYAWQRERAEPETVSFRDGHQRGALRVARRRDGVVTIADIGVETTMSIDEAETVLDDFARRGIAELRIRDDGTHQYVFPSFADGDLDAIPVDDPLAEQIEALAGQDDEDVVLDIGEDETEPAETEQPAEVEKA